MFDRAPVALALQLVALGALTSSCGGGLSTGPDTSVDGGGRDGGTGSAADGGAADGDSSADVRTSQASCTPAPGGPTCAGCCNADGDCIVAGTDTACGTSGEVCSACAAPTSCLGGACVRPQASCGPSTCDGCCLDDATCAEGSQNAACGRAGARCTACTCTPAPGGGGNCGIPPECNGCATGPSSCAKGLSQDACGVDGEPCHACPPGQQCVPSSTSGGTCQDAGACNAQTCPGCCDGATCLYGNQDVACGAGGARCVDCTPSGQTCGPGACR